METLQSGLERPEWQQELLAEIRLQNGTIMNEIRSERAAVLKEVMGLHERLHDRIAAVANLVSTLKLDTSRAGDDAPLRSDLRTSLTSSLISEEGSGIFGLRSQEPGVHGLRSQESGVLGLRCKEAPGLPGLRSQEASRGMRSAPPALLGPAKLRRFGTKDAENTVPCEREPLPQEEGLTSISQGDAYHSSASGEEISKLLRSVTLLLQQTQVQELTADRGRSRRRPPLDVVSSTSGLTSRTVCLPSTLPSARPTTPSSLLPPGLRGSVDSDISHSDRLRQMTADHTKGGTSVVRMRSLVHGALVDVDALQAANCWYSGADVQHRHSVMGRHATARHMTFRERFSLNRLAHLVVQCSEMASLALVLANSLFLGLAAEFGMQAAKQGQPTPPWIIAGEIVFLLAFTLEIIVNLAIQRWKFFVGPDWRWNAFDVALTALSGVDLFFHVAGSPSALRSLKLFRALRAARILRSGQGIFMRDLRLMVASILSSSGSMAWAFLLLSFVLYLFSVTVTQGVEEHVRDRGDSWAQHAEALRLYGSVTASMLTLFKAITNGADWEDLARPLEAIHPNFTLFFVFFVGFTVVGIMNILTAVFVESAAVIAQVDQDLAIRDEIIKDNSSINAIRKLLGAIDVQETGVLTREQLEVLMEGPDTLGQLRLLGLGPSEVRGLFKLLDVDDQDEVSQHEFVCGLMRLRGAAKGVDLATLMYENKKIMARLMSLSGIVEAGFASMLPGVSGSDPEAPFREADEDEEEVFQLTSRRPQDLGDAGFGSGDTADTADETLAM